MFLKALVVKSDKQRTREGKNWKGFNKSERNDGVLNLRNTKGEGGAGDGEKWGEGRAVIKLV